MSVEDILRDSLIVATANDIHSISASLISITILLLSISICLISKRMH